MLNCTIQICSSPYSLCLSLCCCFSCLFFILTLLLNFFLLLTCRDLLLSIEGSALSFLSAPHPACSWDDECPQCIGWRGESVSLRLIRNMTASCALSSAQLPHNLIYSLATITSLALSYMVGCGDDKKRWTQRREQITE